MKVVLNKGSKKIMFIKQYLPWLPSDVTTNINKTMLNVKKIIIGQPVKR